MSAPLEQLLTALAATIDAEFDALRQRDIEALAGAIENKQALLEQLATADPAALDADPTLRERLRACRQANRRVGGALQLHQQLTAELVSTLSGKRGQDTVYAADGHVQRHSAAGQVAIA